MPKTIKTIDTKPTPAATKFRAMITWIDGTSLTTAPVDSIDVQGGFVRLANEVVDADGNSSLKMVEAYPARMIQSLKVYAVDDCTSLPPGSK